jgi:hypothetical protein
MLTVVPAAKLAKLEARVARVPLPSESDSDEDISGSDSDPADREYLPKDYDKESRLASDSSDDEAVLTLVLSASRPCWESLENVGLCTLVSW